jgi:protein SCO1/2
MRLLIIKKFLPLSFERENVHGNAAECKTGRILVVLGAGARPHWRVSISSRMVDARCQSETASWRRRASARIVPAAAALAVLAALPAGCGSSGKFAHAKSTHTTPSATRAKAAAGQLDGPTLANPAPAPPLVLPDYQHHLVNIASYRGKAVLVTFIYTHCPDICPLIVANLHNTLALLGSGASQVRIVGVSVDPRGDTPHAIRAFLGAREMTGRMEYLVTSRAALDPVWHAWGVDASTPDANEQVNHSAMVYGISGSGKVMTIYPANFKPAQLAHDVAILASS